MIQKATWPPGVYPTAAPSCSPNLVMTVESTSRVMREGSLAFSKKLRARAGNTSLFFLLIELQEVAGEGDRGGESHPAEYLGQNLIISHHIDVGEPGGSEPDAHDESFDDIDRIIASIGLRLWEIDRAEHPVESYTIMRSLINLMPPKGLTGLSLYSQSIAFEAIDKPHFSKKIFLQANHREKALRIALLLASTGNLGRC